jgi:hydroxyacylglutathione hydrolase
MASTTNLEVRLVPALSDNYIHLLRDRETGTVGVVDPSEAEPAIEALTALSWRPTYILNTHHHPDHTAGNSELKRVYGAKVIGPAADKARIPDIDHAYADGEEFAFGAQKVRVLDVPGHTRGHIALWFPMSLAVFTGDTMFAMGCGRLFEGTHDQMWHSLSKIGALPDETRVYCGHEYTQANARFALTVDGANEALKARARKVDALRAQNQPTLPSTIAEERATNPFLRADRAELAASVGLPVDDPVPVFAEIRRRKDHFKG